MNYPCASSTVLKENSTGLGLAERIAAPAATVQPNESGTELVETEKRVAVDATPRLVIRGESLWHEIGEDDGEKFAVVLSGKFPKLIALPQPLKNGIASAAIVDYLNCSFPIDGNFELPWFFHLLFGVVGKAFGPAKNRNKGLHGYLHSFELGDSTAKFAHGGNRNTAFLTFSGDACHQIPDWEMFVVFLRDTLGGHLTRLDLATDDLEGVHSVDAAVEQYKAGLFNAGGRKPKINQRGNWLEPDGTGRTFYIGQRKSGKLLRVYEKGMQLGMAWHPWTRTEVELHNIDRIIPWDAVLEPGRYLAGAYPKALSWVSAEQSRIRTLQHTAAIGYKAMTHWASVAYGKQINAMMQVEGSAEKVVALLRREGLPARLDLPPLPEYGKVYPSCEL